MTDRRLLLRAWLHAMKILEAQLRAEQGRARNALIRQVARAYRDNGHPPTHLFLTHRTRVKGVLEDHYRRTIPVFAGMALSQIKQIKQIKSRHIDKKAAQTIYESLVADWIRREALRKATLIADTDRDDVLAAIAAGLDEGLGSEAIARNIRQVSDLTPYRAAVVARTETHAAASFGSIESVREAERTLDIKMLKEWLPTMDNRTRPDHLAMAAYGPIPLHEKFIVGGEPMDRPGDPSASGHNTVNCLHPDSVIQSGRVKAMTRHWHEGKLVVIKTASGKELSVTPNHPILTRQGWVAASLLKEGDGVIGSQVRQRIGFGDLDVQDVVATAEQVYNSLAVVGVVVGVAAVNVDFHGEQPCGNVDVVHAAGQLRHPIVAALAKPLDHLRLASADLAQGRLLAYGLLLGNHVMVFWRKIAHSLVRCGYQTLAVVMSSVRHAGIHALAAVARLNAVIGKTLGDVTPFLSVSRGKSFHRFAREEPAGDVAGIRRTFGAGSETATVSDGAHFDASSAEPPVKLGPGNAAGSGNLINAGTGQVFLDKVVHVGHMAYSGYVYNLETHNGYYICNGIVQHNCRCAIIYEEQGE